LRPGDVVFLAGGLGAGKTRLAQGIAAGLGAAAARSPSFALLHRYRARIPVYHADLYRLENRAEAEVLDLPATVADGVLLVEWPALLSDEFPERLEIELTFLEGSEDARLVAVEPIGTRYVELAGELGTLADPGV